MELKVIISLVVLVVANIIIFYRANDFIGYSSSGYYRPSYTPKPIKQPKTIKINDYVNNMSIDEALKLQKIIQKRIEEDGALSITDGCDNDGKISLINE